MFSQSDFSAEELLQVLENKFIFTATLFKNNTVLSNINNIKTDFIRHNYPYILPPLEEQGIRYLSKEDISAMKLHAIIQSGKRLKDFIDIYFLLEHFSMRQMVEFFTQKYSYATPMIAMRAVTFFEDIDVSIDPPKLLKPIKFSEIKKRLEEASLKSSKIFTSF